jgi:DNA-directed RNA polymerase subunit H
MGKEFDVSKHVLVPKHVKLSEKEKKDLFDRYVADLRDLPRVYKDDPAIQGLDAKEGDIIKISRKSPTAGEAVFYRRVVSR